MSTTVVLGFPGDVSTGGAALADRVRGVAPGLDVRTVSYQDTAQSRSARGRGDMDAAVRDTQQPTAEQAAAFAQADIVLAFDLPVGIGRTAPQLQWIQGIGAGLDHWRGAALAPGRRHDVGCGRRGGPYRRVRDGADIAGHQAAAGARRDAIAARLETGLRQAARRTDPRGRGLRRDRAPRRAAGAGVRDARAGGTRSPRPDDLATVYGPDGLSEVLAPERHRRAGSARFRGDFPADR